MLASKLNLDSHVLRQFLETAPRPLFDIGTQVSWSSEANSDFGIVTGLEYAPAKHFQRWAWRYKVWIDSASPSSKWVSSDLIWEEDLVLLPINSLNRSSELDGEGAHELA